jgi:hypothetical protein
LKDKLTTELKENMTPNSQVVLQNIKTAAELEMLIKSIPEWPKNSIVNGRTITRLDQKTIILIKRKILTYVGFWKLDNSKFESAMILMEELVKDCYSFRQSDENYISDVKQTLENIKYSIVRRKDRLPSDKQKIAINNLQAAMDAYESDAEIDAEISDDLFRRPSASEDLNIFLIIFLHLEYEGDGFTVIDSRKSVDENDTIKILDTAKIQQLATKSFLGDLVIANPPSKKNKTAEELLNYMIDLTLENYRGLSKECLSYVKEIGFLIEESEEFPSIVYDYIQKQTKKQLDWIYSQVSSTNKDRLKHLVDHMEMWYLGFEYNTSPPTGSVLREECDSDEEYIYRSSYEKWDGYS